MPKGIDLLSLGHNGWSSLVWRSPQLAEVGSFETACVPFTSEVTEIERRRCISRIALHDTADGAASAKDERGQGASKGRDRFPTKRSVGIGKCCRAGRVRTELGRLSR